MTGLMDDKSNERTQLRIVDDNGNPIEPFVPVYMHIPLSKSTKKAWDDAFKTKGVLTRTNVLLATVGAQRTLYAIDASGAYWEGPFDPTYDVNDFMGRVTDGVQTRVFINFVKKRST